VDAVTVEVIVPWSEFASGLRVWGGFGTPRQLGHGVLAHAFEESLEARTLVRFLRIPRVASVRDTTGTTRPDSALTFVGGRLVLRLDTLASTNEGPVTLAAGRILHPWDVTSATWELAVDTFRVTDPWPEEGGGPVEFLGTTVWDPAAGDTAFIELDSAQVALLADTTDVDRSVRFAVETPGVRLKVDFTALRLDARPSINPDTVVQVNATDRQTTFVYAPFPEPPPDGIRVGGVPAWRTVLDIDLPETLSGPPELCAAVGCPVRLTPERVTHAELVLTTRATEPAAFQPTDSIRLDVRPVLAPDRLPKAPLGGSFLAGLGLPGTPIPAEAFGAGAARTVAVPITPFVRARLDEPAEGEDPLTSTIALLSVFEPLSIAFASFVGPGGAGEPFLRLVITAARPVELP
ncbi:MAG: hypothetical protein KY453_05355, partial [Gemmatimonadetes bacterium]|nr:hypothetical protein [Gemmatimonadota bacterium]